MPKILHVWNVDIYQPCGSTQGPHNKYTSPTASTPYAVSSSQTFGTYRWLLRYSLPGNIANIYNNASYGTTAQPTITTIAYTSTACVCSASGTAKHGNWNVYKNRYSVVNTQGYCATAIPCPQSTVNAIRVTKTITSTLYQNQWKLYKPQNSPGHTHNWGTTYYHTASGTTSYVTFTDVGV